MELSYKGQRGLLAHQCSVMSHLLHVKNKKLIQIGNCFCFFKAGYLMVL